MAEQENKDSGKKNLVDKGFSNEQAWTEYKKVVALTDDLADSYNNDDNVRPYHILMAFGFFIHRLEDAYGNEQDKTEAFEQAMHVIGKGYALSKEIKKLNSQEIPDNG